MREIQLTIGGRMIKVRSSSNEEHLLKVSEELNERIRETQQVIPDSREALLFVALALTDELMNTQDRLYEIQGAAEDKIENLLHLLESLEPVSSSN